MKSFLLKLIPFSILVFFLDYLWQYLAPVNKHIPWVWVIVCFFMALTGFIHFFSMEASKNNPQNFIRFYMGSTGLRIFGCLIIILAYRYYDKSTFIPFALGFMAHYFAFTIFETPILLKELKKTDNKE